MNPDTQRIFGTRKFSSLTTTTAVFIRVDIVVRFLAGIFQKKLAVIGAYGVQYAHPFEIVMHNEFLGPGSFHLLQLQQQYVLE